MMMTNGFGAILGSSLSGRIIDQFFTKHLKTAEEVYTYYGSNADHPIMQNLLKGNAIKANGTLTKVITVQQWEPIWLSFAAYALVVAILFAILFKHKHNPNEIGEIAH